MIKIFKCRLDQFEWEVSIVSNDRTFAVHIFESQVEADAFIIGFRTARDVASFMVQSLPVTESFS